MRALHVDLKHDIDVALGKLPMDYIYIKILTTVCGAGECRANLITVI